MTAFLSQVRLGLTLAARNRMGLIYGFLFPLVFLAAFRVIYRLEADPLARHLGELLTVTVLGGACFGLPTTLVNERERGVWRRYRLTPTPTWLFVAATLTTRYVLILAAALLQVAVAKGLGMAWPVDPLGLWVAFTVVCAALLALGMVVAMLAPNVPAVQALGQCIFLPMLMIGGVAVRLSSLPDWALHLANFFPGRYAVAALHRSAIGSGQAPGLFDLGSLLLMAAAAGLAACALFRWDPAQRLRLTGRGKLALAAALTLWLAAGLSTELRGRAAAAEPADTNIGPPQSFVASPAAAPTPPPRLSEPKAAIASAGGANPAPTLSVSRAAPADLASAPQSSWEDVSAADFKRVAFVRLPPDSGVVAPVAGSQEDPDVLADERLAKVQAGLAGWPPAQVADPVQRVRNLLYVAAAPDFLQMGDVERFLPLIVFERLKTTMPQAELAKILYWIAMHPDAGDDRALSQLDGLGLANAAAAAEPVRGRAMIYAFKMLGRLTGDIPPT